MQDEGLIDISGLDPFEVFTALYAAAHPQGMGFLHFVPGPLPIEVAEQIRERLTAERPYFDYVLGRVMKVAIKGDRLDPALFDRDNGQGEAERAIEGLREQAVAS